MKGENIVLETEKEYADESLFSEWQIGSAKSCSGKSIKKSLFKKSIYNPNFPVPFLWEGND